MASYDGGFSFVLVVSSDGFASLFFSLDSFNLFSFVSFSFD